MAGCPDGAARSRRGSMLAVLGRACAQWRGKAWLRCGAADRQCGARTCASMTTLCSCSRWMIMSHTAVRHGPNETDLLLWLSVCV